MPVDFAEHIAARALSLTGVPFRLHGRQPDVGLDCVGVVLEALSVTGQIADVRVDYLLRGDHYPLALGYFDSRQFIEVSSACSKAGDLQLLQPGIRQLHFCGFDAARRSSRARWVAARGVDALTAALAGARPMAFYRRMTWRHWC